MYKTNFIFEKNPNIPVNRICLFAGPCVIESNDIMEKTVYELKNITEKLNINFVFKASFDKANRTSINAYRGPGLEAGLKKLQEIKKEYKVKIITDVHEPQQCDIVAEVADIIQIPAFLCRQTDLLLAAAKTNLPINVKKGQFLAPMDMENVIGKIIEGGNKQILLCERGTSFGYNNLVVDMRSLVEMKELGYPIIFDVTHSVQLPGGKGNESGGDSQYVFPLMRAGIAIGIDGIFMEVHPDPKKALSDGTNMLNLKQVENILTKALKIDDLVKSF